MAKLNERIETALPLDEAFAFIADFANSKDWDPGVATSVPLDPGPVAVGSRYQLGIRRGDSVSSMEYVVTALEPLRRVVLVGEGSGVSAIDDIRFAATQGGTRIDYTADIRLRGAKRLVAPFAGGTFAKVARQARDGMQRALDERAATRPGTGA
jgi:carbon monoxide dehydrogenase subunit G